MERAARSTFFGDEELPLGAQLLAEGSALGMRTRTGISAFCRAKGIASEVQWKRSRMETGTIEWSFIMGRASLEEQIAGLQFLYDFGERTGVVIDRGLIIPNWVTGLPEGLRDRAPRGTSFVLGGVNEHVALAQAAPIMPCFNDWHIGSLAAVENTIAAIEAGGSYTGVLAQYVWDLPYVDSDVDVVAENVRAIGIVAQKRQDDFVVDSYMDDGMPAHFADNLSLVGYARLERYVVEELCGARYATGFGQLISDIPTKIAIWLALDRVLRADHPALSYLYGNTIDASTTLVTGNFGVAAAEITAFAATERRYRTGVALLPNPATEALRVPTPEEIADVHAVAHRAAEKSAELETMLDFSSIEEMRDALVSGGTRFFQNTLEGLADMGIDVRDPVQVLLGIRRLGAAQLERLFHPGPRDDRLLNGIVPLSRTEFTRRAEELVEGELEAARAIPGASAVRGKAFIVASGDTHAYGVYVVARVLRALGAEVIEAGVDRDPEDLVTLLSSRPPGTALAVSTHNGQCLTYARRLVELLASNRPATVFIGGMLNAIIPGNSEPTDASAALGRLGVVPCLGVADLVRHCAEQVGKAG